MHLKGMLGQYLAIRVDNIQTHLSIDSEHRFLANNFRPRRFNKTANGTGVVLRTLEIRLCIVRCTSRGVR